MYILVYIIMGGVLLIAGSFLLLLVVTGFLVCISLLVAGEDWEACEDACNAAGKPWEIQTAGATARQEIDQILTQYHQHVDRVLMAEQPVHPSALEMIDLLQDDFNTILEDVNVKQ